MVVVDGIFVGIIIIIGWIVLLLGACIWGHRFEVGVFCWSWSLFILFCSLHFGIYLWDYQLQGRGSSTFSSK